MLPSSDHAQRTISILGSGRPKASQRTRAVRAKNGMIKPQSFNCLLQTVRSRGSKISLTLQLRSSAFSALPNLFSTSNVMQLTTTTPSPKCILAGALYSRILQSLACYNGSPGFRRQIPGPPINSCTKAD